MAEWKSLPCSACGRSDQDDDAVHQELDDKTVALGEAEAWITRYAHERNLATARAERAETEARAGAKLYVAAAARAERAEAAIQRVRALHAHNVQTNPVGTEFIACAVCGYVGYVGMEGDDKVCPTIAALDSTDPAPIASAHGPDYERPRPICWAEHRGMLCDRLAGHHGDHVDIYGPLPDHTWPAALDGTQSDAPAPTRSGEGKQHIGDYDDPPCGICGRMNHSCSADCDCCPEHPSDSGLPVDGEERTNG